MSNAKISIIVPIYNAEKYLEKCLDSIVNQTFKDIEIICVNDGSTDNTTKILNDYKFKDKRIKVIDKENSGYGASMNIGIDAATSDYIGIVESDDFIKPEMYEELYKLVIKNDCDFVKSDFYNYWVSPEKILKHSRMGKFKLNEPMCAKDDIRILNIIPSIWSALYKKDFLVKNNIRFLETPGASYQDTSFHYKTMMIAQKIILTDKAYVYYRNDNENSSVKSKEKVYYICDEYNEIHKYISKHKELECFEQFVYSAQFKAYRWNMERIAKQFKEEFFARYYEQFKKYYEAGYLKEEFYCYLKKRLDFNLFIKNPEKFYKKCLKQEQKEKWDEFRRKIISIRINKERASIQLFGIQILRIG